MVEAFNEGERAAAVTASRDREKDTDGDGSGANASAGAGEGVLSRESTSSLGTSASSQIHQIVATAAVTQSGRTPAVMNYNNVTIHEVGRDSGGGGLPPALSLSPDKREERRQRRRSRRNSAMLQREKRDRASSAPSAFAAGAGAAGATGGHGAGGGSPRTAEELLAAMKAEHLRQLQAETTTVAVADGTVERLKVSDEDAESGERKYEGEGGVDTEDDAATVVFGGIVSDDDTEAEPTPKKVSAGWFGWA